MENVMQTAGIDELDLVKNFEVEELEERMEFNSWSAEPVVEGGGTYTPATGELDYDLTVGVKVTF